MTEINVGAQHAKDIFAKNFKKCMDRANKNQSDIVTDLGITASTVSDWVNAKKYPRVDKMQFLANYLGVLISDLREEKSLGEMLGVIPVGTMYQIPIVGSVRCGFGGTAVEELVGYDYANVKNPENYVFFEVKGDSMAPDIKEGDLALIRQQPDVESGELAVVIVNGDEGTLKKVIKQGNGIILQSFNSEYPPKIFSGEELNTICIYGKVIETKKKW